VPGALTQLSQTHSDLARSTLHSEKSWTDQLNQRLRRRPFPIRRIGWVGDKNKHMRHAGVLMSGDLDAVKLMQSLQYSGTVLSVKLDGIRREEVPVSIPAKVADLQIQGSDRLGILQNRPKSPHVGINGHWTPLEL